ncbi:MAG: hypothetical protein KGK18_10195 [Burkholderiales bacterium]|nr:hypothetical protein [Burkholderiales bacterium]
MSRAGRMTGQVTPLRPAARAGLVAGLLLALIALPPWAGAAPSAPSTARPAPGRYAAQLCVTTIPAPSNCGPAQVDLRTGGAVHVRVDDLVYHLKLHRGRIDLMLMHGAVEIDDFVAPYQWAGRQLQFIDADRGVLYEVRFGARAR